MRWLGILAVVAAGATFTVGVVPTSAVGQADSQVAPAKYAFTGKAVVPLARDFIRVFLRARRSEKTVERHTTDLWTDHKNLTKLTLLINTRVKGDHSPRGRAYYYAEALFRGKVKPRKLATIYVDRTVESSRYRNRGFTFRLANTIYPGPSGIITPRLWTSYYWISGRGTHHFDSCSVKDGRGYYPVLSEEILTAGIREARRFLRQANNKLPLKPQKNVFAGLKPAPECWVKSPSSSRVAEKRLQELR